MAKTIFITGASKGFGKLWSDAFLQAGYNVAATSRDVAGLQDLAARYGAQFLPLAVDLTSAPACMEAVSQAKTHFGTLDVVINNAGYGIMGAVEEVTEQAAKDVFEVNFFASLRIIQAALPILREQGHGHIIQMSSMLGVVTVPALGVYAASKFAVEGLCETLAKEVEEFGIRVTIVEPNGYHTEFSASSLAFGNALPEYNRIKSTLSDTVGARAEDMGHPEATVPAILQLLASDNPPKRLFLGNVGYALTQRTYAERLASWGEWQAVSTAAHR
jgi:NAD(P)-dependent dehydrogenase (short-subunit alcohol dehydrogenase family)